ncbi:MAG: hypothetical protein ACI8RD_011781, partial [Bacillariaceae sp.]
MLQSEKEREKKQFIVDKNCRKIRKSPTCNTPSNST